MPGSASSERLRLIKAQREAEKLSAGGGRVTSDGDVASSPGAYCHGEEAGLHILNATGPLPPAAPGTLTRDANGHVWLDLPYRRSAGGRSRTGVDGLLGTPGLGPHLVRAVVARWPGCAVQTLLGEITAARHLIAPMAELGLSAVPPSELPVDLFKRVEAAICAARGLGEPSVRIRSALNIVRRVVGRIPACDHIERRQDTTIETGKPHWTMADDRPEPIDDGRWGDVETERLVKTCSREILATVAGWNQLAGYFEDGLVGEGPLCQEKLLVARAMLAADPTFPASWRELARDEATGMAMFELGMRAVRGWSERVDAGEMVGKGARRTIAVWRKAEAGRFDRQLRTGGRWTGCNGIMRAGWAAGVEAAYPTRRGLAPFAALLAIQGRLNADVLTTLAEAEFRTGDTDEVADHDSPEVPPTRLRAAPWKARAHRPYPVDFPVTLEPDDPAPIVEFVSLWTARVRERAGSYAWAKFIYVGNLFHSGAVTSYARESDEAFPLALRQLCKTAGVPTISPRELRRIGIDLVHDACDGDAETMRAAGNWRDLETGEGHYFGPSVVMRGQESLGWSIKIEHRRLAKGIEVAGRPRGADLFSATDGFRCRNPLDGPDPQEPGELCVARGMCALCRHGDVDVADPAWSLAQMAALADVISRKLDADASADWTARFAPVLDELLEFWLPFFPGDVVEEAHRLPSISYKELEL